MHVCHVTCVPCHNGMARPQVMDGESLQMWRVAAYILNNKLRTADKGWSSSFLFGRRLSARHRKRAACYEMLYRASDLDEFFGAT